MDTHALTNILLFFTLFFGIISLLQALTNKFNFPYTVLLLIAGFLSQIIVHFFHIESHFYLEPQIIYYILLPLLLFEASMHINLHQFRLQFWTITWISTFGLIISLLVVGFGLHFLIGVPLGMALLFGALISATDPIAVLSIFKSLGAPKRLALIADGESMFNDATAVIAFKLIAAFVFSSSYFQSQKLFESFGGFFYIFFGSIVFGAIVGLVASEFTKRVKNDRLIEASITLALAIGSFIVSEHFFHLSGVITTVLAGVIYGNLGKTSISHKVKYFVNESWEYLAFLSVSLVFFFAAFQLNPQVIISQLNLIPFVILAVLVARAVSVYLSFYISNTFPLFKNEPDVPLRWQHILNWGGLRGVIPLVLAYSIPDSYPLKGIIISFTLAVFVFTLLVNALTIKWLLIKLGLHLPQKEEEIINAESELYEIEQKREKLLTLPKREFYKSLVTQTDQDLQIKETALKDKLLLLSTPQELKNSLRLQAIEISRKRLYEQYKEGFISSGIVHEYEVQLDLQQDSVEYPEVYSGRGYSQGRVPNRKLYRQRLREINDLILEFPLMQPLFKDRENKLVMDRLMALKTKLLCVEDIFEYLNRVKRVFGKSDKACSVIEQIENEYDRRKEEYENDLKELKDNFPSVFESYQQIILQKII